MCCQFASLKNGDKRRLTLGQGFNFALFSRDFSRTFLKFIFLAHIRKNGIRLDSMVFNGFSVRDRVMLCWNGTKCVAAYLALASALQSIHRSTVGHWVPRGNGSINAHTC